ncbi:MULTISPECIES: hypothetical protein [Staphylococcus intermedius group]|uniref:Uncharacterized protein n=1 Tax=Staphylococcus intermedius NCTC 11048 TaxID=1141106 RepID=A0A380G043_STAIN|nr:MULTISPECIES: hypothetical protein [Staphylococcus intermedius group]PCF62449.1 hypothetical protein B5C04_11900 [Staphylococcus intermedius]PCF77698.1 hypothetical protein B4W74_12680 [Staphylococcus intermedius]PCF78014.1 hypothetical protein B4W70_12100 [Staphylococcus intermedius]PCF80092.1 hypothetical protein B4W69_12990 [Staphylococcus delphini]PCF83900.1 hypothetical protein B4W76_12485 [Staphylococcus intermedius]
MHYLYEGVKNLIESDITAAEIGRQTKTAEGTIRQIRLGLREIEGIRYKTLVKLYGYYNQVLLENLEGDTNKMYLNEIDKIKKMKSYEKNYSNLNNVNKNIWLSISMLLDELEVESDEDKERLLLLRKFNDLLISES